MNIIKGNIIDAMLNAEYDIAVHGCNCHCTQKSGVAAQMVKHFSTDSTTYFEMESFAEGWCGNPNKLGCIDWAQFYVDGNRAIFMNDLTKGRKTEPVVTIINAYTQLLPGVPGKYGIPLDYDALRLCMRKINLMFGVDTRIYPLKPTLAIPYLIGGGLARGDHSKILEILEEELIDVEPILIKLP